MKNKKTILFLQLPLVSHAYDYIQANVEYAPASIAGYIQQYIGHDIESILFPRDIALYGSDSCIVDHVIGNPPNILSFTCFLWNIERSLHIARMIKEKASDIQIIFGGSEVQFGSVSLSEKRHYVDYFVIGEGEWFFGHLLSGRSLAEYEAMILNNRIAIQPDNQRIPVETIYEPFTGLMLNPMIDGSMFIEMTRGCPFRCMYCLYSKNYTGVRELSFDLLIRALRDPDLKGTLKELYILSPTFNTTSRFREKLGILADLDHGIGLHSEMRASGVDKKLAELLCQAGFRSMEVGLQTLNIDTLERIGRRGDPEKEIEGMINLKNAGIDLKIGLIPGLPGDTRESFLRTVAVLMDRGLGEQIELYPLMILPGTLIRDKAVEENINFLKKPPYYYNYGWGTSFEEIRDITNYIEEATGYSHVVRKIPDFTGNDRGTFCRGVRFNGNSEESWNYEKYQPYVETNVFSFYIEISNPAMLYTGLPALITKFPQHQLYNIIIMNNEVFDEQPIIQSISLHDEDNLMRRIYIFHEWRDGLTVQVYQVFDRVESYLKAKKQYSIITPIFRIHDDNYGTIVSISDYEDTILISAGTFGRVKKEMKKFADVPEHVAFEDIEEQKEFYAMIGYDFLELPKTFRVVSI